MRNLQPAWSKIRQSPLGMNGGFLLATLVSADGLKLLRNEALHQRRLLTDYTCTDLYEGDVSRGRAAGQLMSAPGGVVLDTLYKSGRILNFLCGVSGVQWKPAGQKGTFSYYSGNNYLGRHRDIDGCDLAVITCLADERHRSTCESGQLILYPNRRSADLIGAPAHEIGGSISIRLRVGTSAIILGGLIPHEVSRLGEKHTRIVAPLCYIPA